MLISPRKIKAKVKLPSVTPYLWCPKNQHRLHLAICQNLCKYYDECLEREFVEMCLMTASMEFNYQKEVYEDDSRENHGGEDQADQAVARAQQPGVKSRP